jgi:hypothetical protein
MHKHTIMAVAILSMIPQISLGSSVAEAMEDRQEATEQPVAETATAEVAATEQPVAPKATDEVPMIPGPPVQPAEEKKLAQEESTHAEEPAEETELQTAPEATEESSEPIPAPSKIEAPAPIEEEPIVIPEETEMQAPAGIDTVSLENPQGNWLYKRIWWERAEERYEKIRLLVDAVWESRTIFFVKRNELDRNVLDPFYLNVGIGQ